MDLSLILVLIIVVGIIVVILIRRGKRKAPDKIDRTISSKGAKAEGALLHDLLQTTVMFNTNVPLAVVRKSVSDTVGELIDSNPYPLLKLILDSERATGWQGVYITLGLEAQIRFQAQLTYSEINGRSVCGFSIPHVIETSGVSTNDVETMTKLRNSVIIAFQRIDPNVAINTM